MKTPICDFVEKYADKGSLRLHMPGHKGSPFLGIEQRDITEVAGADVLYSSSGIIAESQRYASALFGTEKTVYSTEGSSLCIRAMVYSLCVYAKCAGRAPLILAARNAHKTFMGACALCDARVEWLYPRNNDGVLSCMIGADELDSKIEEMSEKPIAVYITSPD
jgi:arginine/lysine/ornithine decarboxylase